MSASRCSCERAGPSMRLWAGTDGRESKDERHFFLNRRSPPLPHVLGFQRRFPGQRNHTMDVSVSSGATRCSQMGAKRQLKRSWLQPGSPFEGGHYV